MKALERSQSGYREASKRLAALARELNSLPLARLARAYRQRASGEMTGGVGRAALTS